jgi:predicted protein tyrosine phosphatase
MIKRIKVVPRKFIEDILSSKPEIINSWALVSVYSDQRLIDIKELEILKEMNCTECLSLRFADLTKEQHEKLSDTDKQKQSMYLFTKEQAEGFIKFINSVNEKDINVLMIHCAAGVSRSGALGLFACRYLDLDEEKFRKDNPNIFPNAHVTQLLIDASGLHKTYEEWWKDTTLISADSIFGGSHGVK